MKYETATVLLTFFGLAVGAPVPEDISKGSFPPARMLRGREVPQEHSHEPFLTSVRASLNKNNPDGIVDPVFGLLGNAAAAGGLGKITDVNCLQQATADQAFTNAKAAGDVQGQVDALIYRALERNTGKVGLASAACTSIKAVNPEIVAISQHQDPASPGAAATNKAIALALAVQIAKVGGNPQDAIKSGTFAPGNLNDNTGKGNTCDTQNDPQGCIFSQNLLVPDVTAAEIAAAVGGNAGAAGAAGAGARASSAAAVTSTAATTAPAKAANAGGACPVPVTVTAAAAAAAAVAAASSPTAAASPAAAASGSNVQTFTGTLGGPAPPVIFTAGAARPFAVDGTTDVNKAAAIQRSCDVQKNACANAANSGKLAGGVGQCETQHTACLAATPKVKRAALNFGTCTDPAIVFGPGFDGRTQNSFQPANKASFNHGSALNIGVITSFICGQLQSACKADAAAISACASGQAAAVKSTGQAAADAFNAALGVSAGAASPAAASSAAAPAAASSAAAVAASSPVAVGCAAAAATSAAAFPATAAAATAPASGTNVQAFTSTLGGVAPPF